MNTLTPVVLAVAGSDPMSGAGIQADLKTAAALGGYCCTVITALTAQNSRGLSGVWPVSPGQLQAQFRAVMDDLRPGAIKVGMLPNAALVDCLAHLLAEYADIPVVLDPVLKATGGGCLMDDSVRDFSAALLPRITLLTPNLDEAAWLLGCPLARSESDMRDQAAALVTLGAGAVLLKGGHLPGSRAVDLLVDDRGTCERFDSVKLAVANNHGTGCTLATAIATGLAAGKPLSESVRCAKHYIQQAIANADQLALVKNNGPLQHFFN